MRVSGHEESADLDRLFGAVRIVKFGRVFGKIRSINGAVQRI
jgi:hypothetical protein